MNNNNIFAFIIVLLFLLGVGYLVQNYPRGVIYSGSYVVPNSPNYTNTYSTGGTATYGSTTTTTTTYEGGTTVVTTGGPCYVGGCSGQICSDQEGMASTCEYREEYACYQGAECKRQTNGQCGWTVTPALAACLSSR